MSLTLLAVPEPGFCVKLSSPPSVSPLGPNQSSAQFLPSFQQRSQTERTRERERAGQEMPSRSQELEWFMCAGMLREEDLGLEESKGPGLRIDLLSKRITKWVGIWLRESFLKGIASSVFPCGMLTSTCRFDVTSIKKKNLIKKKQNKKTGRDLASPLFFVNPFPPKCPLRHV